MKTCRGIRTPAGCPTRGDGYLTESGTFFGATAAVLGIVILMEAAIRRILVATDLSEFSPLLLREAVKLARLCHAELIVAHLYRPQDYGQVFADSQMPLDDYVEKLRAEMRFQVTGPGRPCAGIPVRFQIRMTTDVVEEILFEANSRARWTTGPTSCWPSNGSQPLTASSGWIVG